MFGAISCFIIRGMIFSLVKQKNKKGLIVGVEIV